MSEGKVNLGKHITAIYAVIADAAAGEDEGLAAHYDPRTGWMPLVGADVARIDSFRPLVKAMANGSGQTLRIVKFSERTTVEVIEPDKDAPATPTGGIQAVQMPAPEAESDEGIDLNALAKKHGLEWEGGDLNEYEYGGEHG